MATIAKKEKQKELKGHAIVSDAVRSYEDDSFFVKKTEQARKTLLKVGLPGDKKE